jgi:hypothetical protein
VLPWGKDQPWVALLERDNHLRGLEADEMADSAETVLRELDDLAVLVLFSVFEAIVRDLIESAIRAEVDGLQHPSLKKAGNDVLAAVKEGSFYRVLEPYKSEEHNDIVEQVNQVRRYRNWVAHERASEKPDANVLPKQAYERLARFLTVLNGPSPIAVASPSNEVD